jgi:hypothetical protein
VNATNSIQSHITAGAGYLQPFLRSVHRRIVSICFDDHSSGQQEAEELA